MGLGLVATGERREQNDGRYDGGNATSVPRTAGGGALRGLSSNERPKSLIQRTSANAGFIAYALCAR
jgi:hypothetical protein